MALAISMDNLDERRVGVGNLADYTHRTFHEAIEVLVESNTPEGILKLFIGEINELLEFLEENPEDRVNIVAEFGDLLHFWNDLFQLSDASIAGLLNFFRIDAPANELTIARMKEVATEEHAKRSDARGLLYELKVALRLGEDDVVDSDLIGLIASHIFAVAADLDINPIYAVLMKNLRNRKKYRPWIMNVLSSIGFNYDRVTDIMVTLWNGGDTKFFKKFLDQFPIEWSYVVASQLAKE